MELWSQSYTAIEENELKEIAPTEFEELYNAISDLEVTQEDFSKFIYSFDETYIDDSQENFVELKDVAVSKYNKLLSKIKEKSNMEISLAAPFTEVLSGLDGYHWCVRNALIPNPDISQNIIKGSTYDVVLVLGA